LAVFGGYEFGGKIGLVLSNLSSRYLNEKNEGVSKSDVTVVVPVKDEAPAIGMVIDELQGEGYENILVVDGYSGDGTLGVVREKEKVCYVTQHGRGKTGALKTAIEYVTTPYMLLIDGDHTYPAEDIKRLLVHAKNYGQVIGVRDKKNISTLHRFGNRIITRVFNMLFGAGLSDICSGMYLLKTDVARELDLGSKGFLTEVEVAAQTVTEHSVTEVPIGFRERVGTAKLSAWNGFSIIWAIMHLAWKYNPVFLFSSITSFETVPGLIILGYVMIEQAMIGIFHSGLALMGTLLTLFGIQALALAVIAVMMKRMEHRISVKVTKH